MPAADRSRWAQARARGLDPWREQDACGVGFVARASGHRSAEIARLALQALARVAHRGAAATDRSGDGAGLLTQIPAPLFYREVARRALALAPGQPFAVGAFFLPREHDALGRATAIIEEVLCREGLPVLAWRDVPVNLDVLGAGARASCPTIRQVIIEAPAGGRQDDTTWERSLYLARGTIERRIAEAGPGLEPFFVCSLSCRTLVYKALLTGTQLAGFFPDLESPDYETALAIFHQRYSTNTTSSWPLVQPFRMLAHNGEINTLWGNRNAMLAREPALAGPPWGDAVDRLKPVIWSEGSDSASLDNALELLVRSGRDPVHALMMLVPEAHEGAVEMEPALRGFYEFHECLVEPWDGPAALAFSDGVFVGSALDRNGLRPCRYKITRDGLVVAGSESGLVDLNPADVVESGRLGPGELLVVDTRRKAILRNGEAKREVARRRPYSRWAARGIRLLRPTAAVPDAPPTPEPERVARQVAFGWSFEDLRYVLEPMGSEGHDAVWSMGDDTPIPPLARIPPGLYAYLRQRFAQVTNPAIDPLRETLVMSLRMHIGRRGSLLADRPAGLRLVRNEHPVLLAEEIAALRTGAGAQVVTLEATWSASGGGPEALRTALDGLCRSAGHAVRQGARIVILSDRGADRERAPLPMLLAVGAVHQHLLENGLRTRLGLIAEAGDAWDVHHFAALIGYGAEGVHPWLALESVQAHVAEDDARVRFRAAAEAGLLKILSKMGISTLSSYCGAQIFEALGLGAEVIDRCFTGTVSTIGGIGFTEIAEDLLARQRIAYPESPAADPVLPDHGRVRFRRDGEDHGWSPQLVRSMQAAVAAGTPQAYDAFRARVAARLPASPRDLLAFRAVAPIPLDEVEGGERIRRRFVSTAMCVGGRGAEGHRRGHEAAADLLRGLDLVERDGSNGTECEQVARARGQPGRDAGAKRVVRLRRAGGHRGLHRPHQLWRPAVILTVAAVAHPPMVRQDRLGIRDVGICGSVAGQDVLGDLGEPDPADRRDRARKAAVDHLGPEPQCLEDLGAAVRRERRDPHLLQDLEETGLGRGAEPEARVVLRDLHLHRLEREPRVHRFRPVADQGREVVDVPRVSRFGDEAEAGSQAVLEQVLVHRPDGQEHGEWGALATGGPVAENHDPCPLPHRVASGPAQPVERSAQCIGPPPNAGGGAPGRVERSNLRARPRAQRRDLLREKDGVLVPHEPEPGRPVGQQRAPTPDVHPQRHDQRLAQRVDRRVRDLREALAEIRVQAGWDARERRDWRIVAHAPHGVVPLATHRLEHVAQVLEAPPEGHLTGDALGLRCGRRIGHRCRRTQQADAPRGPPAVGAAPGHLALRLPVPQDRLAARVYDEQLTRPESAAFHHVGRVQIDEPRLRARHHQSVAGYFVAARPQAVTVERRAYEHAV